MVTVIYQLYLEDNSCNCIFSRIKNITNKQFKMMRKLILLMLIASVPFFTMAQKRSKKNKKSDKTSATYEFMVIKGYQAVIVDKRIEENGGAPSPAKRIENLMKSNSKVTIEFEFGNILLKESLQFNEMAGKYRSMAEAVNAVAESGWEFQSADVISSSNSSRIYYYYMTRNK